MNRSKPDTVIRKIPPAWLVRGIEAFRSFLTLLNRRLFPGQVVLYEMFENFWLLPSLYVAAKLDIATRLKPGAKSSDELAKELNVNNLNLFRMMRALSSKGIFRQDRDGRFRNTPLSCALIEGPGSLRHMILHHLGPVNWNLMSSLAYSVETGNEAFTLNHGTDIYAYLKSNPTEYMLFDRSMSDLSDLGLAPILSAYNFSRFHVIADIGGGEGYLMANILAANPATQGILFDTAGALVKAPALLEQYGVGGRTTLVPGDFFDSIPTGADLYLLKNILHNWSDEDCIRLLKSVRTSMDPDGTVLVIDMIVPEDNRSSLAKLLDIQMMVSMKGGRERTEAEFAYLFNESGLRTPRIIPTISPICLIEGRPNG